MHKLAISCFFLLTFSVFSQDKDIEHDNVSIPTSIFVIGANENLQSDYEKMGDYLPLTGFEFLITDNVIHNYFLTDIRNIGRKITVEDLNDNYKKAALYSIDVNSDSNHFIWRMWDLSLQKQYYQVNN